jgi:hypothetical protein
VLCFEIWSGGGEGVVVKIGSVMRDLPKVK